MGDRPLGCPVFFSSRLKPETSIPPINPCKDRLPVHQTKSNPFKLNLKLLINDFLNILGRYFKRAAFEGEYITYKRLTRVVEGIIHKKLSVISLH